MKWGLVLAVALSLAGCHRNAAADVTLDADADARNATEAKINADLAAADSAARAPMPRMVSRPTGRPGETETRAAPSAPSDPGDAPDDADGGGNTGG